MLSMLPLCSIPQNPAKTAVLLVLPMTATLKSRFVAATIALLDLF